MHITTRLSVYGAYVASTTSRLPKIKVCVVQTAMDEVKKAGLSEDERHRVEKEVQKLTDDFIVEVERLYHEKEKSITLHSS